MSETTNPQEDVLGELLEKKPILAQHIEDYVLSDEGWNSMTADDVIADIDSDGYKDEMMQALAWLGHCYLVGILFSAAKRDQEQGDARALHEEWHV